MFTKYINIETSEIIEAVQLTKDNVNNPYPKG